MKKKEKEDDDKKQEERRNKRIEKKKEVKTTGESSIRDCMHERKRSEGDYIRANKDTRAHSKRLRRDTKNRPKTMHR